jgi:hypothetical protein
MCCPTVCMFALKAYMLSLLCVCVLPLMFQAHVFSLLCVCVLTKVGTQFLESFFIMHLTWLVTHTHTHTFMDCRWVGQQFLECPATMRHKWLIAREKNPAIFAGGQWNERAVP